MDKNRINQLKTLLELPGISSKENKIFDLTKKKINDNNLEEYIDNLGSIWGIKKSKKPNAKTILIDAHMDEVGFIVTDINNRGFIKFESIGGVWSKVLNSQRLKVWTSNLKKSYSGVVLLPNVNPHSGFAGNILIEDMLLDIGMKTKKEVEDLGITLGSMITFDTNAIINNDRVISKSVDNRVGVSLVFEIMDFISKKDFDFNIVIGCSSQEEVGLRGVRGAIYKFKPDLGIVVDVSPANDYPGPKPSLGELGEGTMLRHKDATTLYPPKVIKYLRNILKTNKIKYQDYFSTGGTNSGVVHLWTEGRPVIPIGLVARSLHTSSTVFDLNDYEETLKLFKSILNDLNSAKIAKLK